MRSDSRIEQACFATFTWCKFLSRKNTEAPASDCYLNIERYI